VTFAPFPKLARLSRGCTITEKIDGTNAQVLVFDPEQAEDDTWHSTPWVATSNDGLHIAAGSRTRLITPGKNTDNFGFAAWVLENAEELSRLGPGRHFGEWWGKGIQRGYGLDHKRFSLFDTKRWNDETKPACCHVVPVLWRDTFDVASINGIMQELGLCGSYAAPGFMKPEGIVIWHEAARVAFKKTFEHDEQGKEAA
jgi:RNA ligase